ncbi:MULTISPECIES: hypothetical protein [unclassified Marinobacter]|jgi:hypothetical protein|uniref:hypothetical protein n=1 Tax=unclassified Marinobacter TaxID=83889 RepID=UPI00200E4D48|nr:MULTISPECIES: hypothetical protein [unclassified Marinobacter]MCL1483658.1 hypothetical protein [Marinobacter sp.]UQG56694.1 hypothetical protein MIH16_03205 [Marinobacter sp. M4C]UQG65498.1 hypothetical protein MIH17_03205 [Marinobacter sp. M2C]UQG69778.1 hypothetical protein MIH19_03200 [Marinobacter sp. M1C]
MKKEAPAPTAKRLNSPRQLRALAALMEAPRTVRQLLDIVGGNGMPQLIDALRDKGLTIITTPQTGTDRDNRRCRFGEYCLCPASRLAAERLLQDYKRRERTGHAGE